MRCALLALIPYPCRADAGVGGKEKDAIRIDLEARLAAMEKRGEEASSRHTAELEAERKRQEKTMARPAHAEKQQVHRKTLQFQARLAFWETIRIEGHVAFGIDCGGY